MLSMEGDTAAYFGHLKDAREFNRRALDNAQRAGEKDAPATGRDLQYFAALAFAYAGDDARAKALANDLDKSYREDTIGWEIALFLLGPRWWVVSNLEDAAEWRDACPSDEKRWRFCSLICGWTRYLFLEARGTRHMENTNR
jgi:hypothetical protein